MTAEPQSFGKYTVVRSLGRGGMAAVYEGRDALLERRVAIKVILPHLAEDATFADRFRREARLVASLRHPRIVQLYDFEISEGRPYMVMEYLEGGSLKERLAKSAAGRQYFPLEETLKIIADLADALHYAHARGAVHRDIKPANILFTAQNEAVITDFGIVKLLHESQQISNTGGIIGTPQYMSPEQASGKPVDGRSDQYALAITAYEMLAGRVPFTGETATAILMAHLTEMPPSPRRFNPKLSLPLEVVLLKGLAKRPEQRFESTTAFSDALLAAARSSAISASQETVSDDEGSTQIDTSASEIKAVAPPPPPTASTEREESLPREISLTPTEVSQGAAAVIDSAQQPEPGKKRATGRQAVWRWTIGGLILVLVIAASALLLPRLSSLVSSPATTAAADEFVIAVADFDGTQATQKIDIARRIYEELENELLDLGSNVRLVRTNAPYPDKQAAIVAGQETGADLIVWGWYDDAGVSSSIQAIQPSSTPVEARGSIFYNSAQAAGLGEDGGIQEIDLEDFIGYLRTPRLVSDMEFFISNGPEQIAYIAEAVLGMALQAQGDIEAAQKLYDKALANLELAPGEVNSPGLEQVYFLRGMARAELGHLPEAIQDLEQAAALDVQMPEVYYNLAVLYPEICTPQRQLEDALEAGLKAATLAPEDASTQRLLASLYLQLGKVPEALAVAQAAAELDPDDPESHLILGNINKASGNARAAQAAWETGVALLEAQLPEPGQETAGDLIRLGDAFLQAGRLEQARQAYQQAQRLDARNPDIQRGLGNTAINMGDLAGAEQAYAAWVAEAPDDPEAKMALGLVYLKQNKIVQGRQALENAVQLSPCSSTASILAGGQFWLEGDYSQAEAAFSRAVEIEPDNPSALYLLGVSQLLQEKLEPAAATLDSALKAKPGLVIAQRALAHALDSLGRYAQSLPLWQEVVQKLPDDASGWVSLANTYEKLGTLDLAIDAYTRALSLGEDANIHTYIGLVYLQKSQPDQALDEFDQAVKLAPQSSLAHGARGDAYMQLGDIPAAIAAYRQSLALQENIPLRVQLTGLLIQTGDIEGATQELQVAVQADPNNAAYREQLGGVLSRLGHLDEATQQYQSILDGDPNHANAWLGLGQIAYKRCDLDGMTQAFDRAAALENENPIFRALPGAAYAARGALEQQAQVYFNLGQDFPTDPIALMITGEYAWQQGDIPAAREKLDQAAQAAQLPPVLQSQIDYDLGLISLLQNELAEAEEQFRRALEASPVNAASQTVLGDIYLLRGDAVGALEAYNLALGMLPGYALQFSSEGADLLEVGLQARRALSLDRLKQTAEATLAWQQAEALGKRLVDIFPNWPQAHKSLGSVYYLMADDDRASTEFIRIAGCDTGLEKSNATELAYLKQLR